MPTLEAPDEAAAAAGTSAGPLDEAQSRTNRETADQIPGILQLAWPAIVGNLGYSLVGLVDIKIVGTLGASAVAAVTTGNRVFFIVQAVLMAVGAGTTAMVARAWGAGDREEAARITTASVVIGVALALVLSIPAIVFADTIAGMFRLDELAISQATAFIRILSLFNVAFALSLVLGTAIRAAGDVKTPLWIGLVTNVVNVVLVYGLVFGRFGLPAWGVAGAAVASGIAFTVGTLLFVWLWLRDRLIVRLQWAGALTRERVRRLMRVGYPAGLEQGAWQLGFILFLWIVSLYGTEAFAAYGIGVQILSFSFLVGLGFSIAASTHVGQRLGAVDPDGAAQSGWHSMRLAVVAMTVLGSLIILFAESIASFMIDDAEVVRLTVIFIFILGGVQPLMAIEFTLGGALRGAGDTRFPLVTTLTGLILVRTGIAAWLAWRGLSVEYVFAALIGDYIVKAAMLCWRFRSGRWKSIEV
jgi:putative MATE family efflux protein